MRFSDRILEALTSPATVDREGLLQAAVHFLGVTQPDNDHPARKLAGKAMDFAVYGDEELPALGQASRLYEFELELDRILGT